MIFTSINPYNSEELEQFTALSNRELERKLNDINSNFFEWKSIPVAQRCELIINVAKLLRKNIEDYAKLITVEMGKPIIESRAEVNKCAWLCDYYALNAEKFLENEVIESDATLSYVSNDPLGAVFAIMPWNFPFWQVFRFAVPAILAGNVALVKHASNVLGCATAIERIFSESGFPNGVFQNLILHHDQVENVIAHSSVKSISLTGSERAGSSVASIAGKYLKKSVLELGGSNAFIVLKDANIDAAINAAVIGRMLNSGQSCIAAKRFILVEEIYNEFAEKFILAVSKLKLGNPLEEETSIGPLARVDLANDLQNQIVESINLGAVLLYGGSQKGCFHEPTVLGNVIPGMPSFDDETFGPLAVLILAKDEEEAYELSQKSKYGLGLTVFTSNTNKALSNSNLVYDGAYFVNEFVKSDPRLPFGGTKMSGYGRELGKDGMMEFVNRKTIYLK